ncbi:hypothetical protein NDU88_003279 [Pleurodeles waltl]|uniref:Uncharacterized protein n=1 Tax=Pleurodeles waltl TaxID=8319 RepID=A0AAV7KYH9_PLEWA|nr:hypothetical protein NDU88_003279 [Pleurodeles waltl]
MASSAVPPGSDIAMEHNLQEIVAVGRRLEAMDSKIMDLSTDSKSLRADIAGYQDKITDLVHCLNAVKGRIAALPDSKSELQTVRHKLTDLEDKSRRNNVCIFWDYQNAKRAQI